MAIMCPGEDVRWQFIDPNAPPLQPGLPPRAVFEEEARQLRLPKPVPVGWPDLDRQEVGIETWLHVDSDAADAIPFATPLTVRADTTDVWVSADVRATQVVWQFGGDARGTPDPVVCTGPGKAWQPGVDDRDPQRCPVRFFHSGSGTVAVTITYSVQFASNLGPIPPVQTQRQSTTGYQVRGHEAVIR